MSAEFEKTEFVILTDENGVEKEFEHIDTIEDNNEIYMAFIPTELDLEERAAVSYTHLTLPTICSV